MSAQPQGRPAYVVAGYVAALSIFTSLISLAWHPLRLLGVSLVLALVAAGMGGKSNALTRAAVFVGAACFFLAMTITVITGRALW